MKFSQTLDAQRKLSPVEWAPYFLNYKLLKKKIKTMADVQRLEQVENNLSMGSDGSDASSSSTNRRITTPEALSSSQSEVEFFRLMDYEISRGAQFLALSEGQYVLKTRAVLDAFRSTNHLLQSPMLGLENMISSETATEMWLRVMHACISVYTELLLLNHWVIVSYCGFSKILKKHDRWTGFITKEKYLRVVVAKQHFTSYPKLHAMLRDMDALYLQTLRRLPLCPGKVEGEAKMNEIKRVVSAAGLTFADHSRELTSSIQEQYRHEKLAASVSPVAAPNGGQFSLSSSGSSSDGDGGDTRKSGVPQRAAPAIAPAAAAVLLPRVTRARVAAATGAPQPASKRLRVMINQNRAEICRRQSGKFLFLGIDDDAAAAEPAGSSVLSSTPPHHHGAGGGVVGVDGDLLATMGGAAGSGAEVRGRRGIGVDGFEATRSGGFSVGITVRMRAPPPAAVASPTPALPPAGKLGDLAAAAAAVVAAPAAGAIAGGKLS